MTAETTADETPPPIAATTAARLLSLFIVRRLRPGPAGGPGVRRTSGRPNSRLFSPHSLPGPRNQGASAWDFQFGAEAVDRRKSHLWIGYAGARIARAVELRLQEGNRQSAGAAAGTFAARAGRPAGR